MYSSTLWPPLAVPQPTPEVVLPATPPGPNPTAYESPVTTQQGIYSVFGIIDSRLSTQAKTPAF